MQPVLNYLQQLDLHPVADHFTIAILTIAILIDLVASLAPTRTWLRYMALTLMILGALAAGSSYATGNMETDRIWNALGAPAKEVLKHHAELGEYLAIMFGVLALWRLLIQAFTFVSGSRPLYLLIAVAAVALLLYQGHLGGELVYDYGAGTALMAATPVPSPSGASGTPTPAQALPTVTVPTAMSTATQSATGSPTPKAMSTASPSAAPTGV